MQRLNYIDQLKGFTILCVVFGHIMLFGLNAADGSLVYQVVVAFHMPLFAFLSGLMFKRQNGFRPTMAKLGRQSLSLLTPFLVVGLTYTYLTLNLGGGKFYK